MPCQARCVGSTQSNMSTPRQHRVQQIGRRADAHQVARAVGGQQLGREVRDVLALRRACRRRPARRSRSRRTDARVRKAADSRRSAGTTPPCTIANSACAGLVRAARLRSAQRCVRSIAARVARLVGGRVDALVEHHHDVGADRGLHLDRALGREQVHALIDVAAKARALLVDRAVAGQREDLIAARVGEHRARPAHEARGCRRRAGTAPGPGRSIRW